MKDIQRLTQGKRLWPLDFAYVKAVLYATLVYSDDVRIRWLMGLASLGWAAQLWGVDVFVLPNYSVMAQLMPEWVWGLAFFLHGAGAIWRIFDRRSRVAWGLAVNGLGVAVWVAYVVCQNLLYGRFTPGTLLETFASAFLLGTFVATGWTSKSTSA